MANVKINVDVDAQGAMKGFDLTVQGLDKTNRKAKETQSGLGDMAKTLKGECSDAVSGLTGKLGSLGSVMGAAGPVGIGVAAATAAYVGFAKAMWDGLNAASAYAGGINDVSVRTGMSVQFVQQYGKAWELAGVSIDGLSKAASAMDLRLSKTPEKFEALGLSVSDLLAMNPDERFAAVAGAIEGMTNKTEQSGAAASVFGGAWKDVMQGINDGALELAGSMTTLSDDQVATLDRFGDATKMFEQAWTTMKTGLFADLASASGLPLLIENTATALNALANVLKENKATFEFLLPILSSSVYGVKGLSQISEFFSNAFGSPSMPKPVGKTGLDYSPTPDRTQGALFDPRTQVQLDKDFAAQQKQARDSDSRLKQEQDRNAKTKAGPLEETIQQDFMPAMMLLINQNQEAALKRGSGLGGLDTRTYLGNGQPGNLWYSENLDQKSQWILEGKLQERSKGGEDNTKVAQSWDKTLQNVVNGLDFVSRIAGDSTVGRIAGAIGGGITGYQNLKAARDQGSISGMGSAALAVGMQAYEVGDWKQGAATGAMAGAAFGPVGMVVGAGIGAGLGYLGGESDKKKAMQDIKKQLEEQYGSLDKARNAAERYGVSLSALDQKDPKKLQAQLVELGNVMKRDQEFIDGTKLATAGFLGMMENGFDWSGLGDVGARSFGRAFWGYIKENGTSAAAEAFGPALEKIKAQFGGVLPESYKAIERQIGYGKNEAYAAAEGQGSAAQQMLTGWQQQGYTDATAVSDAGAIAKQTIDSSTAALVAMGLDPLAARAEAMKSQAGLLKEVAATARAGNVMLSDDMQALLDEAKANGIQFLQTPMERSVDLLTQIAENTGGLGDIAPTGGSSSEPTDGGTGEGEPGMATGGITRTGPQGRSYTLHNNELVVPLERLPQVVGSVSGGMGTGAAPVQVTQNMGGVTIAIDPMASTETREDLTRFVEAHMAKVFKQMEGEVAYQVERQLKRYSRS